MAKVRYSPPRIHHTHRLELPDHLARFAEEYEALPEGHDTYDAKRISQMASDDPRLRSYLEQIIEGLTGMMGGGTPARRGTVSKSIDRFAGSGSSGSGSSYNEGRGYGFAQGNAFVSDVSENYGLHIEPDSHGGFYGWFHVTRRFVYGLLLVLFLLFLAIYHVPGVLDFFFDVVN
ncbi:hypothetical protein [Aggregatilinea lenta]|uniref:hypothetical protein n=1 Tax=Aggregatilinea lenta TaxID=913108 RepID=UPI000E5A7740|nr:hypothetical protein [Aggregatilinea lenta]